MTLRIELPYGPENPLLDIYPKNSRSSLIFIMYDSSDKFHKLFFSLLYLLAVTSVLKFILYRMSNSISIRKFLWK